MSDDLHARLRARIDRLRDEILAVTPARAPVLLRSVRSKISGAVTIMPSSPALVRARNAADEACVAFLTDIEWADDARLAADRDRALAALDALDDAARES